MGLINQSHNTPTPTQTSQPHNLVLYQLTTTYNPHLHFLYKGECLLSVTSQQYTDPETLLKHMCTEADVCTVPAGFRENSDSEKTFFKG